MAYSAGDILVTVTGTTGSFENWTNSWCFEGIDTADEQSAVDALHDFYDELTVNATLSDTWAARSATVRRLLAGVTFIPSWITLFGGNASDQLPTQLAVRVSLTSASGHNGGPFLSGWSVASNNGTGKLATNDQADIIAALANLDTAIQALGGFIAINRPTGPEVVRAVQGRVGERFDVIRSRGNDTAESYSATTLS